MIIMVEVIVAVFRLEYRIRPPDAARTPAVGFGCGSCCCVFPNQAFIGIEVNCRFCADLLLDTPPKRIIRVAGGSAIGQRYACQPVG